MRVQITHLKAPWPQGAVVGDVLELASVPGWALGKCEPAPDGAEVTIEMPAVVAAEESAQPLTDSGAVNSQIADLQAQVQAQARELEEVRFLKSEGDAQIADLQAKLDAAQSEEGKAKAALAAAEQQAAQEKAALVANTPKASGKK